VAKVLARQAAPGIVRTVRAARTAGTAGTAGTARNERKPRERTPLALDRLIHERVRLGIVSALAVNDRLTFNELKNVLQTTDGNLSVHARKLEEADYIACDKSFDGRVPRTKFRLTASGRRALERYVAHMEALIKAVKS
jgi:DNA-binding MarR family transcriptional regulator